MIQTKKDISSLFAILCTASFSLPRPCQIALLAFVSTSTVASAQVIISDTFDRNGNLDGSTTDTGQTWTVGNTASSSDYSFTTSTAGGGGATSSSTSATSLNAVVALPSQYLTGAGGTLATGVYQLTVSMADPSNMPATGNQGLDVGLGTFSNVNQDPWNTPQNNDNLFFASVNLLTAPNESNVFINGGPHLTDNYSSGINSNTVSIAQGSTNTFVMTLDVTGANTPWTLSATLNGTALTFNGSDTMTYSVDGDPLASDISGGINQCSFPQQLRRGRRHVHEPDLRRSPRAFCLCPIDWRNGAPRLLRPSQIGLGPVISETVMGERCSARSATGWRPSTIPAQRSSGCARIRRPSSCADRPRHAPPIGARTDRAGPSLATQPARVRDERTQRQ